MADLPIPGLETAEPGRSRITGSITLDEVSLGILLTMNSRSLRWSIGIKDSVGRFLIQGHQLVANMDVFTPYRALVALPPGALFVISLNGDGLEPRGFLPWRTTHQMVYRTAA